MLKRCGEGYACDVLALRLPSALLVDPLIPLSRFLSESFFSLCSRWMGVRLDTGGLGGGFGDGLRDDGATGRCCVSPGGAGDAGDSVGSAASAIFLP